MLRMHSLCPGEEPRLVRHVPGLVRALNAVLTYPIAKLQYDCSVEDISEAYSRADDCHMQSGCVSQAATDAIARGDTEMLQAIVSYLHPSEDKQIDGTTRHLPYLWESAIKNHRVDIFQFLVDRNPAYMTSSNADRGMVPISMAIKYAWPAGAIKRMCAFAKASRAFHVSEAHTTDAKGMSPMMHAIHENRQGVVAHIAAHYGPSISTPTPAHHQMPHLRPLAYAAARGKHACIRTLLSAGADPTFSTNRVLCPLHLAISYGLNHHINVPTAEYVVSVSVLANDEAVDVNVLSTIRTPQQYWSGMHALHLISYCDKKREAYAARIAKVLLAVPGIDACIATSGGRNTPLLTAMRYHNYRLARVFMDHGADPVARNLKGKSAIDYLCIAYGMLAPDQDGDTEVDDSTGALSRVRALAPAMMLKHGHANVLSMPMHRHVKFRSRQVLADVTFWRRSCHPVDYVRVCMEQSPAASTSCRRMHAAVVTVLLSLHRLWQRQGTIVTRATAAWLPGLPRELGELILSFVPLSAFVPHIFFANYVK